MGRAHAVFRSKATNKARRTMVPFIVAVSVGPKCVGASSPVAVIECSGQGCNGMAALMSQGGG